MKLKTNRVILMLGLVVLSVSISALFVSIRPSELGQADRTVSTVTVVNTTTVTIKSTTTVTATLTSTTTATSLERVTEQVAGYNSVRVEGKGIMLILNYSSLNLKVGDRLNYSIALENVNSSSPLSLLQSAGQIWTEIYNESGSLLWQSYANYARGPLGPQKESFFKGQSWIVDGYLYVGEKLPNVRSVKLDPGSYYLVVRGRYYNLDLQASEEIGLRISLKISAE